MSQVIISTWDKYLVRSGDVSMDVHAPSPKTAAIMGARALWEVKDGRVVETHLGTCSQCRRPVENPQHHVTLESPTGLQQWDGWVQVEKY